MANFCLSKRFQTHQFLVTPLLQYKSVGEGNFEILQGFFEQKGIEDSQSSLVDRIQMLLLC